jgi:hypothetical protein
VRWDAEYHDGFRSRVDHVLAGDATIDLQVEALTGALIDDGKPL